MTPKSLQLEREVRTLVLDYAFGVSILGLIPIRGLLTLKLLVAAGLILKMMRDVGAKWSFRKGQDILAIFGNLFGGIGAFAMAFMAWLTIFSIGLFVPYVGDLAVAASLFTLTWGLGQSTSQFYANGRRS
ncbi:MAG: hypothetical protein JOZ78_15030 [Chroococcidiopsidaceae cyanobacterium CP_BM_ER_R8_30]|nr:hypothetical protein [Chroococcidiopsidaceae cyanobacterium CP_BM_ER_R8_30]